MKIDAEDARTEADRLQKLLRQSEENGTESRIRLNEERARHAETADQVIRFSQGPHIFHFRQKKLQKIKKKN